VRRCLLTGDWYVGSRLLKLHASESHLLVGDGGRLVDTLAVNGRRLENRQNTPGGQTVCRLFTYTHSNTQNQCLRPTTLRQIKSNLYEQKALYFLSWKLFYSKYKQRCHNDDVLTSHMTQASHGKGSKRLVNYSASISCSIILSCYFWKSPFKQTTRQLTYALDCPLIVTHRVSFLVREFYFWNSFA